MPQRYESKPTDPAPLAQPLHFSFAKRSAPNRILKGAMSEALATWSPTDLDARGIPSKELINVYRHWGEGEIGLILTGNVQPDFHQLEAPGNTIIPPNAPFSGERFEAFAEMAKAAKQHGSLMIAQVSHPGRQVNDRLNPDPVSASDVQLTAEFFGQKFGKPHAASESEIAAIVEQFAFIAEYLDKAGYDGIQLHGAHGYLLSQFLSTRTNLRTDSYGGSITNRTRIVVEVATAIRKRVSPSFILGIKLNSVEFQGKHFSPEEARDIVQILEANRFDFVELSGGTYENLAFQHEKESTRKREAFFIEFAEKIVPVLKETKAYITGGFRTVRGMVDALDTVDGVGLGRPLCAEPMLAKDILSGKVSSVIKYAPAAEDNMLLGTIMGGTQIRQLGKDRQPFDHSDEEQVQAFQKDLETFMGMKMQDEKMESYGYVDLTFGDVPYVTAQVNA
ncbi:FMN-linked oxidoreductase [Polyplosphaeria fusca]|uniref:FMN-linked oxidoreductase n=1 Tax=Polyplosphaeria fusca TaxID=682080 RepID=A0A9P4UVK8_9PLEO|nr:FMN-linked oxidoreductase [Polyplosphaeria fusca]